MGQDGKVCDYPQDQVKNKVTERIKKKKEEGQKGREVEGHG